VGYWPHHVAKKWDRMVGPILPLVVFHVDFFRPSYVFPQKNDVPKRLDLIDVQKVTKTQKYAKTGSPILQS
jgi:hypothetical protein